HLGTTALRELISNAGRATATAMHRARYEHLMATARASPHVTDADLRTLRLAAISAGVMHYGDSVDTMRTEVATGRAALTRLPEGLRELAGGLRSESIAELHRLASSPEFGGKEWLAELRTFVQHNSVNGPEVLRELEAAHGGHQALGRELEARHAEVRSAL